MEFEDLSENVKREAQRIAMSYEVTSFQSYEGKSFVVGDVPSAIHFKGVWKGAPHTWLHWTIDRHGATLLKLSLDRDVEFCLLTKDKEDKDKFVFLSYAKRDLKQGMTQGLYRLGIEDEDASSELNSTLSAHEKLELRLSLPREFWPKTWLDPQTLEEDG